MTETLEDKAILKEIINLAKKHEIIEAVYKGYDPEEADYEIYYFIGGIKYNPKLSDTISNLEITLTQKYQKDVTIMRHVGSINRVDEYPHLGKCVWRRD